MTASDAESLSMRDLLAMATDEERDEFENLWLGYTETYGAPDLRAAISDLYTHRQSDDILCFAGASEGIYVANTVILDKDSHAITVTPNYQSHESLPLSICDASAVALNPEDAWSLDIDEVASLVRPNTKLITINFPHNPTGAILSIDRYKALIELCRKHDIYILHDEIFNGLGPSNAEHLPFIADVYEKGLSLNVMSKSFGLPGLRIGWIACEDKKILSGMERMKHYLSIANSGPSERLTKIALRNREKILARNCGIVDRNLSKWDAFFERHSELFEWVRPDGSCTGFPKYKGDDGVEQFTQSLLDTSGVLLLPGSIYASALNETPTNHFRLGYGRENLDLGIAVIDEHIQKYYS